MTSDEVRKLAHELVGRYNERHGSELPVSAPHVAEDTMTRLFVKVLPNGDIYAGGTNGEQIGFAGRPGVLRVHGYTANWVSLRRVCHADSYSGSMPSIHSAELSCRVGTPPHGSFTRFMNAYLKKVRKDVEPLRGRPFLRSAAVRRVTGALLAAGADSVVETSFDANPDRIGFGGLSIKVETPVSARLTFGDMTDEGMAAVLAELCRTAR